MDWRILRISSYIHFFFFSSRRRHTRLQGDWSSDVCSSDLAACGPGAIPLAGEPPMAETVAKRNPKRCPTHPGALLREDILPALKLRKTAIADALGISRQHLYDILRERKPVSAEVAVRLSAAFGDG